MISSLTSSLRLATMKNTRLMVFEIAQSMPKSQQDSYQGSTIWFRGKATLRKRIPRSLYWQFSIFKGLSLPITRTTLRSRQQHPSLLIQPHRWLGPPLHQWQGPWQLQQRNVVNLLRSPSPSEQKSLRPLSCLIFFDFPPPSPTRVERFFHQKYLRSFGFPPQYSTRLGGFSSINLVSFSSLPWG